MPEIVYLDPEFLQNLPVSPTRPTDPDIIKAVTEALKTLDPETERLVRERFFEGLSLTEIADRNNIEIREVVRFLYEGKRQLKILLADFVKRKWGINPDGLCRVCGHPKRIEIERILLKRDNSKSWGNTCHLVEKAVGERFYPPQVLKAHIKHIKNNPKENSR